MSGIAAIFSLDGAPVDSGQLNAVERALSRRADDGVARWQDGSIALVWAHSWRTAEDIGLHAPVLSPSGRYRLVADGRLDNRAEVVGRLGLGAPLSDPAIAVAAFDHWGESALDVLVGDLALVLWDTVERRLVAGRDVMGVRPLQYARFGQQLVVASTTSAVAAAAGHVLDVNDGLLAELTAGRFERWAEETAFRAIRRLRPGYVLSASPNGLRTTSASRLEPRGAAVCRTERDYIERFGELLRAAVVARLRSAAPVALMVSGGVDSSSIACLANRAADEGGISGPLHAYSYVFDRTPAADERKYLDDVMQTCGRLAHRRIVADDLWALREFGDDEDYPLDEPEISLDRALTLGAARHARAEGCRVVVTGFWADQILGSDAYRTPKLLRDLSGTALRREGPRFAEANGRTIAELLVYAYGRRLLPARLRRWAGRRISGEPIRRGHNRPGPIDEAMVSFASEGARYTVEQVTNGLTAARLIAHDVGGEHVGVDWRFPFFDRRLVEFVLAMPTALRFRDGLTKYVLRQAMHGILPDAIRLRRDYAHFTELQARGVVEKEHARIDALLANARTVLAGYLDATQLRRIRGACRIEADPITHRSLVGPLVVEAWLRRRERFINERGTMPSVASNLALAG